MLLKVRAIYQYQDLRFEKSQSLRLGLIPEFLPNPFRQVRSVRYLKGSVECNLVSEIM